MARACLALQDEAEANVNLILWCCWRAWRLGQATDRAALAAAEARAASWHRAAVVPLRALRHAVRQTPKTYAALKAAELAAEEDEQALILDEEDAKTANEQEDAIDRLALAHQALRHYLVGRLGMSEGAAAPAIDHLLAALRQLD
ncbi:MAG: TIGR02444 family protein [Pseudomonadota bacterium]